MLLHTRRIACILNWLVFSTWVIAAPSWLGWSRVEASVSASRLTFATSGTIDPAGIAGTPAVRFVPGSGVADSATPFALGSFVVDPPGAGSVTHYDHTPVQIWYWTRAIDGASTMGSDGTPGASMAIRGWLTGTVGGTSPAALSFLFDQGLQPADPRYAQPRLLPLPPVPAASSVGMKDGTNSPGTLSLLGGQSILTLDPTGVPTPIEAQVNLTPNVPEPAPWLVFALLSGALGVVRCRRPMGSVGGRS